MKNAFRLLLALAASAWVGSASALEVPKLQARVNDNAAVLNAPQRKALEDQLKGIEVRTTAQVAILTIKSLEGADLRAFSIKVVESWKLGQKGKDNGVLILYTLKEDRLRLEIGYGLEGAIPDGLAGEIIRKEFRQHVNMSRKDYAAGFRGVVEALGKRIDAEYKTAPGNPPQAPPDKSDFDPKVLWFFGIVVLAAIAGFAELYLLGAVIGGIGFAVVAYFLFGTAAAVIGLAALGAVIGLVARFIADFLLHVGVPVAGAFIGGGGGFGGGGADG